MLTSLVGKKDNEGVVIEGSTGAVRWSRGFLIQIRVGKGDWCFKEKVFELNLKG